ncbi:MAG: hypothetical protein KF861_09700 [Planctomycetaceae bacterium]|nr:hypothetical protein [Planctomycetaceae bacterium]
MASHRPNSFLTTLLSGSTVLAMGMSLAGCQPREERVLDIEAPGVDVEVNRSIDDGSHTIEVETDRPSEN